MIKIKYRPKFHQNHPAGTPAKSGATAQPSLWDRCKHIAKMPDILGEFTKSIRAQGLVGEKKNASLIYLAVTSRKFPKPVPVVVKGDSSGGKNGLLDKVTSYFPRAAYYELTGMSDKALLYLPKGLLKNRILIIAESHGLSSEKLNYYIRTIISEGYLRELVVVSAKGGHQTKKFKMKGPTGVITTATSDLHRENETRMITVRIDESSKVTTGVMVAQGKQAAGWEKPSISDWVAFQKWVGNMKSPKVMIPFAEDIAKLIPPTSLRLRRDHPNLITLISAHALIHKKSRKLSADGSVIAEFCDYDSVRKLVGTTLAESAERSVTKTVRETVIAVRAMKRHHIAANDLAQTLGVVESTATRRVAAAVKAGYLVNDETRTGHPLKIALGNALPEDQELLPSAKKVAQHYAKRMAKAKQIRATTATEVRQTIG
jgi:hypothetical protein